MSREATMREIGVAVRSARRFADLTQAQLGVKISKTKQAISRIENGHIMPSVETLMGIARHTGVTADSLTGLCEPKASNIQERVERLERSVEKQRQDIQEIISILNHGDSDA